MKYKIGDIVKIKENLKVDEYYGDETFVYDMRGYRGRQAKITHIYTHGYDLDIDDGKWFWTDDMLEPVSYKKYEVTVAENTVIVKDSRGNEGIARCSPEDEFNLSTGISLAISRLGKPSFGERYFTISFTGKNLITGFNWTDDDIDNTIYERGLVFKTKEEAEKVAKIMLDSIKEK